MRAAHVAQTVWTSTLWLPVGADLFPEEALELKEVHAVILSLLSMPDPRLGRARCLALLLASALLAFISTGDAAVDPATVADDVKQEIRIPHGVTLTKEDTYVCTTVKLPSQPMKLVGVIPQASMDVVHHILLFGCNQPFQMPEDGKPQPAWECGAVCADGGYQIVYGWGR